MASFLVSDHDLAAGGHGLGKWRDKYCIVVPVQFKLAGLLIQRLLNEGVRVITLSNLLKNAESFRTQLPWKVNDHFVSHECDLHSITSVRATLLWIKMNVGEVHLLIYLLPKQLDNKEELFDKGMEHRLQPYLDASLDSARIFLRQAEQILFPICCPKFCNSDLMWIVRYNMDFQDEVLHSLLKRMASDKFTGDLCKHTGNYAYQFKQKQKKKKNNKKQTVKDECNL